MSKLLTVEELMTKDPEVLRPGDALEFAAREMDLAMFRHLPVVDRNGRLIGLVSKRDITSAGDLSGRCAEDVMIEDVKTVGPQTAAHEAALVLLQHKVGCVPVVDVAGKLVGIVTESDFVRVAYTLLGGRVPLDIEERD